MNHFILSSRHAIMALAMFVSMAATAQKTIGDFIESKSNNEDKRGVKRSIQYQPTEQGFYCINGNNRFTRALYGSYSDFRLETSDRPIFALFKKGKHRSLRFTLNNIPLEQTDTCEAIYHKGTRQYLLYDKRWSSIGKGWLSIEAIALPYEEGALFTFNWIDKKTGKTTEPAGEFTFKTRICNIAGKKIRRNGDIGADPAGIFEPAQGDAGLVETPAIFGTSKGRCYVVVKNNEAVNISWQEAEELYKQAQEYNTELANRIVFSTPDPRINTLGAALSFAADGDWDGKTWLHGCIGWRMPLAGWRAGYLGDVLGWNNRARSHFDAYAKSQVTAVPATLPHPNNDPKMHLARAEKKWGTQMYSNGYICRNPERNDQMHHYDMNLNYIDELLWHFCYNADTAYMRKMWPLLTRHLAWEKRNFDPDNDHLYDAYCCIWASDALYYNGGAVTHSSAYNYRANRLVARIAHLIGEDGTPYQKEADAILEAMNSRLWIKDKGHWAEYQDLMGLKRVHESAALWSIYTPIDCEACSSQQAYQATNYVTKHIPHIDVEDSGLQTIATSNWLPYSWSINNVAAAEVMHTALAYFEAGRAEEGYQLMMGNIMDQMYYGACPGNFGQISYYDAARGECYRDFGDCIGISARTLLQGLFGIVPNALFGECIIRPGFPSTWDSASVSTPYLKYKYRKKDGKHIYEITQNFAQPLKIVLKRHIGQGIFRTYEGNANHTQTIVIEDVPQRSVLPMTHLTQATTTVQSNMGTSLPTDEATTGKVRYKTVNIKSALNDGVSNIYRNQYLTPRPPYTTLQLPTQGIGEWCHPDLTAEINDSLFRSMVKNNQINIAGIPFRSVAKGNNIAYTSLWDNYPDSITIPLKGKARYACLLMAGSTNHMQSRIANAVITITYKDGSTSTMPLVNPDNWCPIEQDYFIDNKAFCTATPRPMRVCLNLAAPATETGATPSPLTGRDLGTMLNIKGVYGRPIPGGAAQILRMPLQNDKALQSITLRTLSNDVVVGLMAVTLQTE